MTTLSDDLLKELAEKHSSVNTMANTYAALTELRDETEKENRELRERVAILQSQVDNADATWQIQKNCTDSLRAKLAAAEQELKWALTAMIDAYRNNSPIGSRRFNKAVELLAELSRLEQEGGK